jgi:hypothetical protein
LYWRCSQRVERRCFVDVDRRVVQLAHRLGQPLPVLVLQAPGAQPVLVELAHRAEHAHDQLGVGHLHAEDADRQAAVQRDVLGHVHGEGRVVRDDIVVRDVHPARMGHRDALGIGYTRRFDRDEHRAPCPHRSRQRAVALVRE